MEKYVVNFEKDLDLANGIWGATGFQSHATGCTQHPCMTANPQPCPPPCLTTHAHEVTHTHIHTHTTIMYKRLPHLEGR
jgi:hypothetical protein